MLLDTIKEECARFEKKRRSIEIYKKPSMRSPSPAVPGITHSSTRSKLPQLFDNRSNALIQISKHKKLKKKINIASTSRDMDAYTFPLTAKNKIVAESNTSEADDSTNSKHTPESTRANRDIKMHITNLKTRKKFLDKIDTLSFPTIRSNHKK